MPQKISYKCPFLQKRIVYLAGELFKGWFNMRFCQNKTKWSWRNPYQVNSYFSKCFRFTWPIDHSCSWYVVETVLTGLSGSSWPDQIIHETVTLKGNVWHCVYWLCYLYYSCLWFVSVWFTSAQSGTLDIQPDLGKPSRPSQAKPAVWEALRSVPGHVTERKYWAIYFWEEFRMDSFAVAPMTS
jgi:hypothetical protein